MPLQSDITIRVSHYYGSQLKCSSKVIAVPEFVCAKPIAGKGN
jgi:hypothetical protein